MGVRALKQYGVVTERKSTIDFERIGKEISSKFEEDLQVETFISKCYRNKETHGDLDLLVKIDQKFNHKHINLYDYIKETFKPNAIYSNSGVNSFDYQEFQIDIIPIRESNWVTAKTYFSYDPLGNLMGKVFHKFGLSYGWDGLKYKFRNFNGNLSEDITISKDPEKIFSFGDYNYNRFLEGFNEMEEIFEFVLESKYFDNNNFKIENFNHTDRKRNIRRSSFNAFIQYLEDNQIERRYNFNKNKRNYIDYIDSFFPETNFKNKLRILEEKNELNKQLANKFNGKIIMSWFPNLLGKELGDTITNFKKSFGGKENYNEFILNNDLDEIKTKFIDVNSFLIENNLVNL